MPISSSIYSFFSTYIRRNLLKVSLGMLFKHQLGNICSSRIWLHFCRVLNLSQHSSFSSIRQVMFSENRERVLTYQPPLFGKKPKGFVYAFNQQFIFSCKLNLCSTHLPNPSHNDFVSENRYFIAFVFSL